MKDNEENLKQSQSSEELKNEDQNLEKEDLNKNENESIRGFKRLFKKITSGFYQL